jgi:hypothetical protein
MRYNLLLRSRFLGRSMRYNLLLRSRFLGRSRFLSSSRLCIRLCDSGLVDRLCARRCGSSVGGANPWEAVLDGLERGVGVALQVGVDGMP